MSIGPRVEFVSATVRTAGAQAWRHVAAVLRHPAFRRSAPWALALGAVLGFVAALTYHVPLSPTYGRLPGDAEAPGAMPLARQALRGVLTGAGLMLALHFSRIWWLEFLATRDHLTPTRWPLALSAGLGIVFLLAALGQWPAHMTQDSLAHWNQAVTPGVTLRSLGVAYTLSLRALSTVWSSPASAVAAQVIGFLTLAYFWMREWRLLGVGRIGMLVGALLVGLWPASIYITTSLWKDSPYSLAVWGLALVGLILHRKWFERSCRSVGPVLAAYALLLATCMLMRVNGVATGLVVVVAMPLLLRRYGFARRLTAAGLAGLLIFAAVQFLVIPRFDAKPTADSLKAWHALHALSAYAVGPEGALSSDEAALLERSIPIETVRQVYNCQNVGTLVFGAVRHANLAEDVERMNRAVLRKILWDPLPFLRHFMCTTSFIWRTSDQGSVIYTPRVGIGYDPEIRRQAAKAGLAGPHPAPELERILASVQESTLGGGYHEIFWRPAWALYAALAISIYLAAAARCASLLVPAAVVVANTLPVALTALSPDYRYQFGVTLIALSLVPLLLARRLTPSPEREAG